VEQRESIPMSAQDMLWVNHLDEEAFKRFRSISGKDKDPEFASVVDNRSETQSRMEKDITSAGADDSPQVTAKPRPASQILPSEELLADKLATQWQKVIVKDEVSSFRTGVAASNGWKMGDRDKMRGGMPVDWRDRKREEEKDMRRRYLLATAPTNAVSPAVRTKKPVIQPNPRKVFLNPNEPEYRQSRLDRDAIPAALLDPRRRQYGFHYGLPKQKKLLRAANARSDDVNQNYDQQAWTGMSCLQVDLAHTSNPVSNRRFQLFPI